MTFPELFDLANAARQRAYAPYSGFQVGAALATNNERVFTGTNVENISYGLTCCAERSAVFAAVNDGSVHFQKIVIVADSHEPVTPCGACRQVLAEFSPELLVISANLEGKIFESNLRELLPRPRTGILDR